MTGEVRRCFRQSLRAAGGLHWDAMQGIRDYIEATGLQDYVRDTGLDFPSTLEPGSSSPHSGTPHSGSDDSTLAEEEAHESGMVLASAPSSAAADLQLARMESEHAMAMVMMRHERELSESREAANAREKALRREVKLRGRALQIAIGERDALANRCDALSTDKARLAKQLAEVRDSDSRHAQQLAELRMQKAAETQGFEVQLAAKQERFLEVSARATAAGRLEESLRSKVEASALKSHDAESSARASQEALSSTRRELGGAVASRELMAERVSMLQKEVERLDETARSASDLTRQKESELREVVAALAAAREQRNQAAREAEVCRVSAAEAADDVARGAELIAASDARVANAERRLTQESFGRQRAEAQLADEAVAQRTARAHRQRRMIRVLLSAASAQRAVGFARWVAAAAAIEADCAHRRTDEAAHAVRLSVGKTKQASAALDRRGAQSKRTEALGAAWLACLERWLTLRGAAAAFGKWAGRARAEERILSRWRRLVFRAETSPEIVLPRLHRLRGRPTWRLLLHQRAGRLRAYHKRAFWQQRTGWYDSGRIRRAIFSVWRWWSQSQLLREANKIAEAKGGLHVGGAQPWWEAT